MSLQSGMHSAVDGYEQAITSVLSGAGQESYPTVVSPRADVFLGGTASDHSPEVGQTPGKHTCAMLELSALVLGRRDGKLIIYGISIGQFTSFERWIWNVQSLNLGSRGFKPVVHSVPRINGLEACLINTFSGFSPKSPVSNP